MGPRGAAADKLLSQFERIYIINLPSRADRRREIADQLERIGLSLASPGVRLFPAVRPADAGGFDSIGARGCFLSHLGVLKDSVGLRSVLILEDDVNFIDDMQMPALPSDWDVFYGDGRHDIESTESLTLAKPHQHIGCTHFVAFNSTVIKRVADYLEALLERPAGDPAGGPMHVDGAYSRFRASQPNVKTILAVPGLGYQRPSRTDIHDLNWYDRFGGVRTAAAVFRKVRQRLIRP